jgi:hypothetical protein
MIFANCGVQTPSSLRYRRARPGATAPLFAHICVGYEGGSPWGSLSTELRTPWR